MTPTLVERIRAQGLVPLQSWPKMQRMVDSPLYAAQEELERQGIHASIIEDDLTPEGMAVLEYLATQPKYQATALQIAATIIDQYK